MDKRIISIAPILLASAPAMAEESWTDIGIYLFATGIVGEARIGSVTTDVDIGFDDIIENFDMGYMGYIGYRRDKWSFTGVLAHLRLAVDDSKASDGIVQADLDCSGPMLGASYRM